MSATTPASAAPSFESLIEPLLDSAFGAAYHMSRNHADAQDIVQEAAYNACRSFHQFQPGTNFKAWFFRILTNCFLYRYRRKKRGPEIVDLEDASELYMFVSAAGSGQLGPDDDPAGLVLSKISTEHVNSAIESLPVEFRVVASLYFMQEFAYQEIAEILDCPVGTVRSRLHRARRMLQKSLWNLAQEHGVRTNEAEGNPE
ncbi:MAG: sigma-70 family RNA polymerase sigma factor [Candidatus Eisenbacteria bacterium]|uniref:Sigma-70 family RNA polymerase sigma factor n=1 Tax=Eiseniibacteriota bacterium TaxID=2212470 RepID=A0A849SRC1_UNCEI|nr:sigma-70 family RNA polymerase sigma factor [Candidatus Eisenbacteria bacterium]